VDWRELAVCESLPWSEKKYFFGDAEDLGTHKQHELARLYCYSCPVQIECLEWCVQEDMFWGVWGGLTESQRKRYLMPAVRKDGASHDVLVKVLDERGQRIIRQLDKVDTPVTIRGFQAQRESSNAEHTASPSA